MKVFRELPKSEQIELMTAWLNVDDRLQFTSPHCCEWSYHYPTEVFNITLCWRMKPPELPSIDWSHVAERFQWLTVGSAGIPLLWVEKPSLCYSGWGNNNTYSGATSHSSFKRGQAPWEQCCVQRPA